MIMSMVVLNFLCGMNWPPYFFKKSSSIMAYIFFFFFFSNFENISFYQLNVILFK